jgi:hypothetical protein
VRSPTFIPSHLAIPVVGHQTDVCHSIDTRESNWLEIFLERHLL